MPKHFQRSIIQVENSEERLTSRNDQVKDVISKPKIKKIRQQKKRMWKLFLKDGKGTGINLRKHERIKSWC